MPEQAQVEFEDETQADTGNTDAIKVNPRTAGLRPWQPGQSGNPSGRPRKKPLTEELERLLDEIDPTDKKHRRTYRKRLVVALAEQVIKKGNVAAFAEIADRVEGKVAQRQEHTGVNGGPMQFETVGSREEAEAKIAALLILAQERQRENVTDARQPTTIEGTIVPVTIPAPSAQPVPLPLADISMQPFADSSNVAAAGYDPVGRTLLVQYLNGGHYFWREIPPGEYQALRAAGSPGGYLKGIETRYGLGTKIDPVELKSQPVPGGKPSLDLSW